MNKIIFLKGLQGSGKTTLANKILKENKNAIRLNKDDLRVAFFSKNWTPKREKFIVEYERLLAHSILMGGHDLILDNTHFNPSHENFYRELAKQLEAEFELIELKTDINECIIRDENRKRNGERFVGKDVILNTAAQYGLLKQVKPIVIFDMDGTLSSTAQRQHYVRNDNNNPNFKPNWPAFFKEMGNDEPRIEVIDQLFKHKNLGYEIVICSGRPEDYRDITENWLRRYNIYWDRLIMRPKNDSRDDTIIKQEMLDKYLDKSKIFQVWDDRPKVCRMWQQNGLIVNNVGDGKEF